MSFSQLSKEEVAQVVEVTVEERKAELAAMIKLAGSLKLISQGIVLEIKIINGAVAKRLFQNIKDVLNVAPQLGVRAKQRVEKSNTYILRLETNVDKILEQLEIKQTSFSISNQIPGYVYESEQTRRAYIRGLYFAKGAIVDPKKSYGLELVASNEEFANEIVDLLALEGINAKIVERNKGYVVYNRRADDIFTFLNLIGASQSSFAFMEIKMLKEMRNDANRQSNCDIANSIKTSEAAQKQIEQINELKSKDKFKKLSEKDQMVAELRCEFPEYSLANIAEEMELRGVSTSRSGVNHSIRRIAELAKEE